MIERLHVLDRYCREMAPQLRDAGAALDRDPDSVVDYVHQPAFNVLHQVFMPTDYRDAADLPPGADPAGSSCLEWAVTLEAISYGDPGVILANAGPGLARDVVEALGSPAQREWFYGRLNQSPTWTFFALTEPRKGSAAIELETTLTDGLLNGEKRYVGNGARGEIGVVFCRRAPGPWGIEAVLVDTTEPGFTGELLPMLGLRGARISRLKFEDLSVPSERILGRDRPPSRRGLYGALNALMRFRPGLAAMVLGIVTAVVEYVCEHRPAADGLDAIVDRASALRRLVHDVATEIDHGVINSHRIGAVKMRAARLGEDATILAADLLGPGSLIEHPWLEKAYRDVRGFEFMEGTANIHRLSVFQGLLKNDFFHAART